MSSIPVLQMQNVRAHYRGIEALKGVSFDLFSSEIHALVGEHGAGKSTLVKILSGAAKKSGGEILFRGKRLDNFSPASAIQHGIGMLYQELTVIPSLNAVDNIYAGQMATTWYGRIDYPLLIEKTRRIFTELDYEVDIFEPLRRLPLETQYMVELARMLSYAPDIFILDEISSKLPPDKMEVVYRVIQDAKNAGKSVIYISHNMDEIFRFADRVTILKDGYRRGTEEVKDLDRIKLIKLTYSFVLSREELEKVNIKLQYFKQYNETIIQNLPVGVIILDSNNRVYLINHAAIRILNLSAKTIREQSFDKITRIRSLERKNEIIEKIKSKEKHVWEELTYGQNKYLKVSIYPFHDEEYFFLGTIILIEDISKEKYLKEYLLRTEKISSIAELAAGVAHEINNPLSIVQNHLELFKIRKIGIAEMEKVYKIEREIKRIGDIVKNLLSFSKLNELPDRKVNLVDVIDDVVLLLGHKIREKNIRLEKGVSVTEAWITGDENRLKQLLMNLLVNSIEAVMSGGMVRIDLKPHNGRGYVELMVIDDGYGIPKEIMENIFDPFFSTKAGKTNTGLGLAICQHVVELHQGLIYCRSTPGAKTTFTVRFPLQAKAVSKGREKVRVI